MPNDCVSMISEKLQEAVKTVRKFVREEVFPLESDFLRCPFRELLPRLRANREKVKALGLWAPHVPTKITAFGEISRSIAAAPTDAAARPIPADRATTVWPDTLASRAPPRSDRSPESSGG